MCCTVEVKEAAGSWVSLGCGVTMLIILKSFPPPGEVCRGAGLCDCGKLVCDSIVQLLWCEVV